MAQLDLRRQQNVAGDFYVDDTCIDCDTCRWMAPEIFARLDEQSAVRVQPNSPDLRVKALQALVSCPTASIGTMTSPKEMLQVQSMFPLLIADGVFHCGYHSQKSFGAASYFIQHSEGNILVDSPRFTKKLAQQLEALGGIRYLYLTHRDDVADHQKFRDYFSCDRILHQADIEPSTESVEIQLLGDDPYVLYSDVTLIPVPGHTRGHTVMHYRDQFLFTGDHLAWSDDLQKLIAFKNHCWYSWEELGKSMEKLLAYSFEWVLPGHGRRHHAPPEVMKDQLQDCVTWIRGE